MSTLLARDDRQSVIQVGSYDTANATILDGTSASAASVVYTYDTILRVQVISGDNWIQRAVGTAVAVDQTGMYLAEGSEITMLVFAGESIATIGGSVNTTPVAV